MIPYSLRILLGVLINKIKNDIKKCKRRIAMDLKEKNVKSIFDEIGFMNNKRLGRCFQTRRKKYYFDTGTGFD